MANYLARPQVGFLDACKLAIQKCVTFTGRTRRSEFWWATLGLCIINLLLSWIPLVSTVVSLFITLVSLSLCFRRLHDTNHSGWLVIANFACGFVGVGIIFIGAIVGGLSFADLSEGEEYLAENLSTALMGVSAIYNNRWTSGIGFRYPSACHPRILLHRLRHTSQQVWRKP